MCLDCLGTGALLAVSYANGLSRLKSLDSGDSAQDDKSGYNGVGKKLWLAAADSGAGPVGVEGCAVDVVGLE